MIDRKINNKSVIKTKIDDNTQYISDIEVSSKIKLKMEDNTDSQYLCKNSRKMAGEIGKTMELKIEELLRKFTKLSYKYGADDLLQSIDEIIITAVEE